MNSYATIYVPSISHDRPAPIELVNSIRAQVKKVMAKLFGGFTEYQVQGGWYSSELDIVIEETIFQVKSFSDSIDPAQVAELETLAQYIKTELDQEAVSIEVNNDLRFI